MYCRYVDACHSPLLHVSTAQTPLGTVTLSYSDTHWSTAAREGAYKSTGCRTDRGLGRNSRPGAGNARRCSGKALDRVALYVPPQPPVSPPAPRKPVRLRVRAVDLRASLPLHGQPRSQPRWGTVFFCKMCEITSLRTSPCRQPRLPRARAHETVFGTSRRQGLALYFCQIVAG